MNRLLKKVLVISATMAAVMAVEGVAEAASRCDGRYSRPVVRREAKPVRTYSRAPQAGTSQTAPAAEEERQAFSYEPSEESAPQPVYRSTNVTERYDAGRPATGFKKAPWQYLKTDPRRYSN